MPITVYQPSGGVWSPGMQFLARSDSISVDSVATTWLMHGIGGPAEQELFNWYLSSSSNEVSGIVLLPVRHPIPAPERGVPAGTSFSLEVSVQNEVGETDTLPAPLTLTWDPTMALWSYISNLPTSSSGGFTDADRALLGTVDATTRSTRSAVTTSVETATGIIQADLGAAWKWVSQDLWRDHPLTIGPTCDPIDIDVSLNALLGVVLTIDRFPESVVLRTPDSEWSFPDLAVLKFVRNGEILARHGVHTLTHTVSPLPGCVWIGAYGLGAPIQPTGYHITVDWLDGVCGHLTGLILPV
jgi:hypothetical protein